LTKPTTMSGGAARQMQMPNPLCPLPFEVEFLLDVAFRARLGLVDSTKKVRP